MSKPDIVDTDWLLDVFDNLRSGLCHCDDMSECNVCTSLMQAKDAIQAMFKENYKRLALELIGKHESGYRDGTGKRQSIQTARNNLRKEQDARLRKQLYNMKGE
jgi:hypothetical protein